MNWLRNAFASGEAALNSVEKSGTVLVRKNEEDDGWHIADPESGLPVLGDFLNQYETFDTREDAIEFVTRKGYKPVFD